MGLFTVEQAWAGQMARVVSLDGGIGGHNPIKPLDSLTSNSILCNCKFTSNRKLLLSLGQSDYHHPIPPIAQLIHWEHVSISPHFSGGIFGMEEQTTEITRPIIVDLGKQRAKKIKQLKRGKGKLWTEVIDVVEEVSAQLGDEAEGKTIVPLVLVYRKKDKRKSLNSLLPFAPR
jgi:hypothetical protein